MVCVVFVRMKQHSRDEYNLLMSDAHTTRGATKLWTQAGWTRCISDAFEIVGACEISPHLKVDAGSTDLLGIRLEAVAQVTTMRQVQTHDAIMWRKQCSVHLVGGKVERQKCKRQLTVCTNPSHQILHLQNTPLLSFAAVAGHCLSANVADGTEQCEKGEKGEKVK